MAAQDRFTEGATDALKNAGKTLTDAAAKAGENASLLNSKVIDQVEENTRHAFAALRSAAGVKSVQELAKIQADFMKEAAQRSQNQIKEFSELIVQFGKEAMSSFQPKQGG